MLNCGHSLVFFQRNDFPEPGERPVDRLHATSLASVPPGHHLRGFLAGRRVLGTATLGFGRTGFLATARGRGRQRGPGRRAGRTAHDRVLTVRVRQPFFFVVVGECF